MINDEITIKIAVGDLNYILYAQGKKYEKYRPYLVDPDYKGEDYSDDFLKALNEENIKKIIDLIVESNDYKRHFSQFIIAENDYELFNRILKSVDKKLKIGEKISTIYYDLCSKLCRPEIIKQFDEKVESNFDTKILKKEFEFYGRSGNKIGYYYLKFNSEWLKTNNSASWARNIEDWYIKYQLKNGGSARTLVLDFDNNKLNEEYNIQVNNLLSNLHEPTTAENNN